MKRKIYKLLAGAKRELFALVLTVFSTTVYSQITYTFNYTGTVQTLNLQAGSYEIECWGADGGDGGTQTALTGTGGIGGYSKGVYAVSSPTTLYIYVGGVGQSTNTTGANVNSAAGGWNGGGSGHNGSTNSHYRGGGGGGTDVRTTQNAVYSDRIIVAGGGGGAGGSSGTPLTFVGSGGNGGGTSGQNGVLAGSQTNHNGKGGTQSAGGTGGVYGTSSTGGAGSFGVGGDGGGTGNTFPAGGGGGGWYGGGGGAVQGGGGGGGSGYIGGVSNGTTIMFGQTNFVSNPDVSGNGLVIIRSLCDVSLLASNNPICYGAAVTLSTNAGSNIQWSTGPTTPTIVVSPQTTTTYSVSGVSSSSTACSSTLEITVVVNPLPQLTTVISPSVLCPGFTATVIASGGISYSWTPGTPGMSNTIISPTATSVYTLAGENIHGCINTHTYSIQVDNNVLTVSGNTAICEGNSAHLTVSGGLSYLWNNGSIFPNTTVHPSSTTNYIVHGTDQYGCSLSNSLTVTVNPVPVLVPIATNMTVCKGDQVELSVSGASTYTWGHGGNGITSTPIAKLDVPTTYVVSGTNAQGCTSSASISIMVEACVDLSEKYLTNTISVFPNPGKGNYSITGVAKLSEIIVTDVSGRLILIDRVDTENHTIDLTSFGAGIYYVNVNGQTMKLVKE